MTATQVPIVRFGELLGVAARHSSATFDRILAEAATPFEEWVAFTFLTRLGGVAPKADFISDVAKRIKGDEASIAATIDRMIGKQLISMIDANGQTLVELTPTGTGFYRELGAKVDEISTFELSTSSPEDIEAARRVRRHYPIRMMFFENLAAKNEPPSKTPPKRRARYRAPENLEQQG